MIYSSIDVYYKNVYSFNITVKIIFLFHCNTKQYIILKVLFSIFHCYSNNTYTKK